MKRSARLLDGATESGLVALVALAPLSLAVRPPWLEPALVLWATCLVVAWGVRMLVTGELAIPLTPLLWPGLALLGLVTAQLVMPGWSVSPYATARGLWLLVAHLAVLVVLSAHLVDGRRLVRLLVAAVGGGVLLAVSGPAGRVASQAMPAWLPLPAGAGRVVETLASSHPPASHLATVLLVTVGLLLGPLGRRRVPGPPGSTTGGKGSPGVLGRAILAAALAMLGAPLLLSGSWRGLAGVSGGLLVVALMSLHRRRDGGRSGVALVSGGAAALLMGGAVWLGAHAVGASPATGDQAAATQVGSDLRGPTLLVAGESPVVGLGLGAFEDAVARYRPPAVSPSASPSGTYLRILAETGLAGVAVLAWTLVGVVAFAMRHWMARRDPVVRGLATGGVGALAAAVTHGAIGAGLHEPGNALLLVTLLAALVAMVTLRLHRSGYLVELAVWRRPLSWRGRVALGAVLAGVLGVATGTVLPVLAADGHARLGESLAAGGGRPRGEATALDLRTARGELLTAVRLDPRNPDIQAGLARVSQELGERAWRLGLLPDGRLLESRGVAARLSASQDLLAEAHAAHLAAVDWRPRAGVLHERLAWCLGTLEELRRAVLEGVPSSEITASLVPLLTSRESLVPRALDHLRQAIHWDPGDASLHLALGRFALAYLPADPASQELVAEAFRRALALEPGRLAQVVDALVQHGAGFDLYRAAMPRSRALLVALGHELERRDRAQLASSALEDALQLAEAPAEQAEVSLALAAASLRRREPSAAVAHARRALVLQPADPAVFAMLGSAYEALQRWDDAEGALSSAASMAQRTDAARALEYRGRLASVLVRRGHADRAIRLWLEALQAAPSDVRGQLELARLLEARGDRTGAASRYRMAQDLAPADAGVQGDAGRGFLRLGQLADARVALESATRARPADAALRLDLAETYRRMGWPERAAEQYRQVLALHPGHEGARLALAGGASGRGGSTP